jgi:hypothetical protein
MYCVIVPVAAVGNKLLMLFFPFLRKWTYARMHEQVRSLDNMAVLEVGAAPAVGLTQHEPDCTRQLV